MFTIDPELWSLFVADNAKCLHSYKTIANNIDRDNWKESIQQLYRDAHTIKGGAATIGAEEILTTAKAIENVLAELRYLSEAPHNLEGELKAILIELGQILDRTVERQKTDEFDSERIKELHEIVKERCLSDWNEEKQLHQEFADQGFDLMVLDLEMAIEALHDEVPESIVELALTTMEQLLDVGEEIKLGQGWRMLLQSGMELSMSRDPDQWRREFPRLLKQMKDSAREGGKTIPEFTIVDETINVEEPPLGEEEFTIIREEQTDQSNFDDLFLMEEEEQQKQLDDLFEQEAPITAEEEFTIVREEPQDQPNLDDLFAQEAPIDTEEEFTIVREEQTDQPNFDDLFLIEEEEQKQLDDLFEQEAPITAEEEFTIVREEQTDQPNFDDLFLIEEEEQQKQLENLFEQEAPIGIEADTSSSQDDETVLFSPPMEEDNPVDPELRALFDMDTQKYLQVYFSTVEQLNADTWKKDIQQIYRAIHTIKGGAATVGANPILQVAKVLEDWLSDLRSLENPPTIDDAFRDSLLECGELLIATLSMGNRETPTSSIEQIVRLHNNFKQAYADELSEESLMQKEFAEQGFDLMTLDLEMCIEQLNPDQQIDRDTIEANQQVLQQLAEIGTELKLTGDWNRLIEEGKAILETGSASRWIEEIPPLLKSLKEAAKHGGSLPQAKPKPIVPPVTIVTEVDPELKAIFDVDTQKYLQEYFSIVESISADTWKADIQKLYRAIHTIKGGAATVGANPILQVAKVLEDWLSDLRSLEEAPPIEGNLRQGLLEAGELLIGTLQMDNSTSPTAAVERVFDLHQTFKQSFSAELDETVLLHREFADQGFDLMVLDIEMLVEQLTPETEITAEMQAVATQCLTQLGEVGSEIGLGEGWQKLLMEGNAIIANTKASVWQEQWGPYLKALKECARRSGKAPEAPKPKVEVAAPPAPEPAAADIQIPVPLERLDRSAQYLVETMMATRATQGFYQVVQRNLVPLVSLAQDSAQYISRLREVQDDFAVLDADNKSESGVKLERYRQGYTAINRLLEITLRLMELGSETGEAARRTSESLLRLEQSLRNLQGTLEESRLVPFESLAFRARGILRDLTTRMNKPARLYVEGEKLELDAGTLRNLEPVLLHLIRNSFDHGLEPPEEREKAGKPKQGRVDLSLSRRGSVFVLELKDDGRGINPDKIRSIAESKGLPLTDTSTNEKLLAVICQPGFTSAKAVSDISGRGVGMDVVASQVTAMGGQLSLKTKVGVGTTFTIQIPVPNLFVRCMLLQTGDRMFAVPTQEVFTTMLLDDLLWRKVPPEENRLYSHEITEDRGQVPALDLFQYWQGDRNPRTILPTSVAVRAKRSENTDGIWLIADNLVGQSELLVNSLPAPMVSPIGILGVSLMPDGKLIPVIDANALMDALLGRWEDEALPQISALSTETETIEEEGIQIVVVDDAALMRRRIESSLTPQGYKVITCNDGLEAWDWLQSHPQPALLITDIEMPNMDGFTLIDHCRQAQMTMPILVVSSRLAEEWSRETKRLGATDFLTKGFGTPELLEKVASLIEQPSGV